MGSCQSNAVQSRNGGANTSTGSIYYKREENVKSFSIGISLNSLNLFQTNCEYSESILFGISAFDISDNFIYFNLFVESASQKLSGKAKKK